MIQLTKKSVLPTKSAMNQPCLPVPRRRKRKDDGEIEVSFANVETMDAMEYMAAVIKQASAMPEVFVAPQPSSNVAVPSMKQQLQTTFRLKDQLLRYTILSQIELQSFLHQQRDTYRRIAKHGLTVP
jgi:hypothetical protein